MKKLTQERIKQLANEIYDWLAANGMDDAICIYYGNERIDTYSGDKVVETDRWANDYCSYAPWDNIITISSEGMLYDWYDMKYDMPAELEAIWEKDGLYCECNESWNWSLYPSREDLEVEYPNREAEPPEPTYIFLGCRERLGTDYPKELDTIMQLWYDLGQTVGDQGLCAIGYKMSFRYKDVDYDMSPVTGFQGEYSHVKWVDTIKNLLSNLGATNIHWDCGRLD